MPGSVFLATLLGTGLFSVSSFMLPERLQRFMDEPSADVVLRAEDYGWYAWIGFADGLIGDALARHSFGLTRSFLLVFP